MKVLPGCHSGELGGGHFKREKTHNELRVNKVISERPPMQSRCLLLHDTVTIFQ